ncbi:Ser/Thr protein phosphatase family [Metarhizium album ARSEF 1941]|uniref:Ser/Thr protein phosphatase family n=1 Tax=Metarhizium album (strain ARSEF 1941) TaxID=1081103 RepID=A0A0B2X777_METAS|nr:Ser/Thr protein phosphatase family [Metarhizium album ARSEF 1941]KHO01330.1 Ser/Thr protein phosphatase family [Metarhizium album ARSEF 1941]
MAISWTLGVTIAFASGFAHGAQPGAVQPVAAPMRDLTWGQLNFLHTTDTHGWLSGHLLEPQYSADWGDYISFAQHMKKRAHDTGSDLLLVDTGDRVEGNGLYDASNPKGLFYYDLWAEQHVDLICVGNHELYQASTADYEANTTVPIFGDKYVASNVDLIDRETGKRKPLAQRYRKFKTENRGLDIVAFGFLFDFQGNANNTAVQPVAETIKEKWFQEAIREKPDLFVVAGHVGLRMPEFRTIFTALRKQNWHTPIVFFGGHAHVRDALSYDSQAFAMASGRYFETIGFMSIGGIQKKSSDHVSAAASFNFNRKYMDTNLLGMYYHTGLNDTTFPTDDGRRVSEHIARARKALDLDHRYGCAPQDLWTNRARYPSNESIYSWIQDQVLPDVVANKKRKDKPRLAILNTGGIRFDIFKGPFTRDSTYIVSPFTSGFNYVPDVPYKIASKVLTILNSADKILGTHGAETKFMAIPEMMFTSGQAQSPAPTKQEEESKRLELRSAKPALIRGYTTKDDIGTDGDDTVHEAIPFYAIPNCIQSRINFPEKGDPETVDLVYIDFIQPWIMPALKFAGGDYSSDDARVYMDGTLTYKLSEWISKNWQGDC